ncbi:hypothetical protein L7750_04200 [Xenorhabdus bovienii]|uniref:hypothetical protein n=1 Tax=Xenorhabdus bovienii TaxID=40576 RepID=UPI001EDD59A1|nr:hypothetical protein [Xenorhabdus bovienii]MCG3469621.1 hypothetical protein [Xenorhabdus bovienii]
MLISKITMKSREKSASLASPFLAKRMHCSRTEYPFMISFPVVILLKTVYTQWISRCSATVRERIPKSIDNYVIGVSERSQQSGNL